MHYPAELIFPRIGLTVEQAVEQIMAPFSEHAEGDDRNSTVFWDWYQIGGRFSGCKITSGLDEQRLDAFYEALKARKVTVSGLIAGKQRLEPTSQEPIVDALWREYFPDSPFQGCPLFKHAGGILAGDIMQLREVNYAATCSRVIIGGRHWDDPEKLEPTYMLSRDVWNGCNVQETTWDGTIGHALALVHERHFADLKIENDWLVVTVDYHS